MSDSRVAGHPLSERHPGHQLLLLKEFFNAPVFPKVPYLELHDGLTGHGEPEMARLYDTRMNRPDRHLKDSLALDPTKRVFALFPFQDRVPSEVFLERMCALWANARV